MYSQIVQYSHLKVNSFCIWGIPGLHHRWGWVWNCRSFRWPPSSL